jgi:hypothetical protein
MFGYDTKTVRYSGMAKKLNPVNDPCQIEQIQIKFLSK